MPLEKPVIFERDDHIYMVAPVVPIEPTDEELASFDATGFDAKAFAPNEKIGWLRGQYVEADRPNKNGAEWTSEELAIKSITPRLMPVSVMHDFTQLVGVIADVRMRTPDADQVPRARIDNTLAIWRHRYPDIWEEIAANYKSGDLMQSMECLPGHYDCGSCGRRFLKLPGDAESVNWCEHLRGEVAAENGAPIRRLGDVTFTGTGLIFGSRGIQGAYDEAHLEVLQEEVASFHERAAHQPTTPKPKRRTNTMEIEDTRAQELMAAEAKLKEIEPKLEAAEELAAKVPDLERQAEEAAIAQKAAEDAKKAAEDRAEELAEAQRAGTLKTERLAKLGKPFRDKLPEVVANKLEEQAAAMKDPDWDARLEELAAMVGVKPDEAAPEGDDEGGNDDLVTSEEVAAAGTGKQPVTGMASVRASESKRKSTIAALAKSL